MRTLVLSILSASLLSAQSQQAADLVLVHGTVLTVNATDQVAQAIAIRGQRIIAVGTDAEVLRFAGAKTRRIDLRGRTVTPGLLDAHSHFANAGTDRLFLVDVSYPAVKTTQDFATKVAAQVARVGPGEWVEGRGWDEGKLAGGRLPTAADLDPASPRNPVWLENTTGHYGVANSLALAKAGITRETPDPPNGTIDRYPDGRPTGVLKEAAQGLVLSLIPARTAKQLDAGIRDLAKAHNAEGMTGVKDPGISGEVWDAYRRVAKAGQLPVRVFALWRSGRTAQDARALIAKRGAMTRPYESTGDDHVIAGGIKVFMDGSGGARTAWMHDEWNKNRTEVDAGNRGYPAANADTLRALIRLYHDAGLHVSTHAIGDAAIDWVVDTYAQAMAEHPIRGLRHGIIHANIPSDHSLAEMVRLERDFDAAYPEPSSAFTWWIGDIYAANFGARAQRLNPFATYLAKGIPWANGSDFDVTPFPARYGIWAAVARRTLLGASGDDPFGRAESVDVHAALRAATIWPARQMFLERQVGSIEVGKYADLAVWDRNLYAVPTDALKDLQCEMTLFNGKVVYTRAPTRVK